VAAVVSCSQCGHPLPADAEFCPSCGKAAEIRTRSQEPEAEPAASANGDRDPEATMIRSGPADDEPADRWEE
jgi:predicted amidophosphoribosyltransferase